MWIPRPIYEAIPYLLAAAGAGLMAVAYYWPHGPRGGLLLGGGVLITLGLVLWMKRRDYRSTDVEYDPHSLDD